MQSSTSPEPRHDQAVQLPSRREMTHLACAGRALMVVSFVVLASFVCSICPDVIRRVCFRSNSQMGVRWQVYGRPADRSSQPASQDAPANGSGASDLGCDPELAG